VAAAVRPGYWQNHENKLLQGLDVTCPENVPQAVSISETFGNLPQHHTPKPSDFFGNLVTSRVDLTVTESRKTNKILICAFLKLWSSDCSNEA